MKRVNYLWLIYAHHPTIIQYVHLMLVMKKTMSIKSLILEEKTNILYKNSHLINFDLESTKLIICTMSPSTMSLANWMVGMGGNESHDI